MFHDLTHSRRLALAVAVSLIGIAVLASTVAGAIIANDPSGATARPQTVATGSLALRPPFYGVGTFASDTGRPNVNTSMVTAGVVSGTVYYGVAMFNLAAFPSDATLISATLSLIGRGPEYGISGTYKLRLLAPSVDASSFLTRTFSQIASAPVLATIPPTLTHDDIDVGVTNVFTFTEAQVALLADRIATTQRVTFRIDGPTTGEDDAFSWESGQGLGLPKFSPILTLGYSRPFELTPPVELTLPPLPTPPGATPVVTTLPPPITAVPPTAEPTGLPTIVPPIPTIAPQPMTVSIRPSCDSVGYVRSFDPNLNHFGETELFTGYYNGTIYHGAMQFDLSSIPAGARIVSAQVSLTGRAFEIEDGGTYQLVLLSSDVDADWPARNYYDIHNATVEGAVPPVLSHADLQRNNVNTFTLTVDEQTALTNRLSTTGKASFRLDESQMINNDFYTWDTGCGSSPPERGPVLTVTYIP